MSQKSKLIVLLILMAALLGAMAFQFLRPGRKVSKRTGAAQMLEMSDLPGIPSESGFGELMQWVASGTDPLPERACRRRCVFGLEEAKDEAFVLEETFEECEGEAGKSSGAKSVAALPSAAPFVEPPRLQGVLITGRIRVALFEGEPYRLGQRVRNTAFRVMAIASSSVKLQSARGDDLILELAK